MNAVWNPEDEDFLVAYLVEHRAEFGDGSNPKEKTWEAISRLLSDIRVKGGPKTVNSCKRKYSQVLSSFPRGAASINETILAKGNLQYDS